MPDNIKRIEFPVQVTKAYTKIVKKDDGTEEKKHYVDAIASDTSIDYYMERMSEDCIERMAEQCNDEIIILPTHYDTFHIGKTVAGEVVENPINNTDSKETLSALKVTIELNMEYPQAKELYNEVAACNCDKQLSIGGWLNPENDEAAYWEESEVTITYPDGTSKTRTYYILVLDDIILDHIAITRNNHAANRNTGFLSAIAKSLRTEYNEKFEVVKSNIDSNLHSLKRIKTKGTIIVDKDMKGGTQFISRDELPELQKGVFNMFKSIISSFTNNTEKEVVDNMGVEDKTKSTAAETQVSEEEVTKNNTNTQEQHNDITTEGEKEKSTEEVTEEHFVTFNQEKFKSELLEEVMDKVKSVNNQMITDIVKSVTDTVSEALTDVLKSQIKPLQDEIKELNDKIKSIEEDTVKVTSIEGQDDIDGVEKDAESENIWKGTLLTNSIVSTIKQRAAAIAEETEEE